MRATCCCCAVLRRFQLEAAPILARLLASGSAYTPPAGGKLAPSGAASAGGVGGGVCQDDAAAPGSLQRVRVAALACLEAVCACSDAWAAVKGLTWGIAQVRGLVWLLHLLAVSLAPALQL